MVLGDDSPSSSLSLVPLHLLLLVQRWNAVLAVRYIANYIVLVFAVQLLGTGTRRSFRCYGLYLLCHHLVSHSALRGKWKKSKCNTIQWAIFQHIIGCQWCGCEEKARRKGNENISSIISFRPLKLNCVTLHYFMNTRGSFQVPTYLPRHVRITYRRLRFKLDGEN